MTFVLCECCKDAEALPAYIANDVKARVCEYCYENCSMDEHVEVLAL